MWTRGVLYDMNGPPMRITPWYPPMQGYPGYWSERTGRGHVCLQLGRGHMNEVAPGFGYAKDPTDPATWRHQPTIFT